jgi:hypothetical protein
VPLEKLEKPRLDPPLVAGYPVWDQSEQPGIRREKQGRKHRLPVYQQMN